MDRFTRNNLHLNKSDNEIHASLEKFAMKWHGKASKALITDRISRF